MSSPRARIVLRPRLTPPSPDARGRVVWESQEIGRLTAGEDPLKPNFTLLSDEHLAAIDKENITKRIETWLAHHIEVRLKPLV